MVDGQLISAFDWRKEPGEESGTYSYRADGQWFVVKYGPGSSTTYLVTDYDDAGLQWLLQHERKEETGAQD